MNVGGTKELWAVLTPEEIERLANHPEAVAERERQERHAHRQRPHCPGCGRFGRYSTVGIYWGTVRYLECANCGSMRVD